MGRVILGKTPLDLAAENNHAEVVGTLYISMRKKQQEQEHMVTREEINEQLKVTNIGSHTQRLNRQREMEQNAQSACILC